MFSITFLPLSNPSFIDYQKHEIQMNWNKKPLSQDPASGKNWSDWKKNNLNKLEKNNSALPLWKKIFHFELFPISRLTLLESPNMRGCDWVENSVKCVQS